MLITFLFDARTGRLTIHPDPAKVVVHEVVVWALLCTGTMNKRLRWEIDFRSPVGSPFRARLSPIHPFPTQQRHFDRETDEHLPYPIGSNSDVTHDGTIGPVAPDDPGDYKYDVRVADAQTNQTLADDDPFLQVIP
jgi:hypothetical protein